jgi:hypothetical protein
LLATNAVLVITSSYDRGSSTNPRNVQVVELSFYERAMPGTFGDWSLQEFTDEQLADPAFGAATADPDHDGVANLAEFAMGGDPLVANPSIGLIGLWGAPPGSFAFTFRERKSLGDVQRLFESSTNLANWVEVTPSNLVTLSNLPDVYVREAVFPEQYAGAYYRLRFAVPSSP